MGANEVPPAFPLLHLPFEIRYQIYCHHLFVPRRISLKTRQSDRWRNDRDSWSPVRPTGVNLSLFYVCRSVSKEAIRAFYNVNAFNITTPLLRRRKFDIFYSQSRNALLHQPRLKVLSKSVSLIRDLQISRSFLYPGTNSESPVQRLNNLLALCNLQKLQIAFTRSPDLDDFGAKWFLIQLLYTLISSRERARQHQRSIGVDVTDLWPLVTGRLSLPSGISLKLKPVTELTSLARNFNDQNCHEMLDKAGVVRFGSLKEMHVKSDLLPDAWNLVFCDLNWQSPWRDLGSFETWEDRPEQMDYAGSLHLRLRWRGADER